MRVTHRQRLEEIDIHYVECGHVYANAQGQDGYRRKRESRGFFQQAGAKAQILNQAVKPVPTPGFPRPLRQQSGVAAVLAVVWRHHVAVSFHVLLKLLFQLAPVQQVIKTPEKLAHIFLPLTTFRESLERRDGGVSICTAFHWATRNAKPRWDRSSAPGGPVSGLPDRRLWPAKAPQRGSSEDPGCLIRRVLISRSQKRPGPGQRPLPGRCRVA